MLDFGGARATFTVATQTFPYQRVVVHGSSGVISLTIPFNAHADTDAEVIVTTRVGTREVYLPAEDQYILEFEAFAEAIRNQETPPISPTDTVNNMKVLDALTKSHQTGQWESV